MQEVWKPIEGYEGLYEVSSLGNVRSLDRRVKGKDGKIIRHIGLTLKPSSCRGYLHVILNKDGHFKACTVHRLVANAFIPNADNKPQINHIDGDKANNRVDNLEWVTQSENIRHSYETGLRGDANRLASQVNMAKAREEAWKTTRKPVLQLDMNSEVVRMFCSENEAARETGVPQANISKCLLGKRNKAGGYQWRYA